MAEVNFPELEKKLLAYWAKEGIVDKYLAKNKNSDKYFSFLDGPITANNPMGVHHAWGRTYKDLWQRYKNMQGYKQRFQNGFDCQGLWVEVEVEKELGFKNKKDIEIFGVEKFVNLCKERVKKYSAIQTDQSQKLGYFMDWEHSYYTLSDENNYAIWHFLKVCHDNGWLYKGVDVAPWCPRCETAISQHEMLTEDYKEITHETVYVAVPIIGKQNEYLLFWTTTPWTIPANTAIAVDHDLDYVLVEIDKKHYWLQKDRAKVLFGPQVKIIKTSKGSALVGLKYQSPYDHLPYVGDIEGSKKELFHSVVATDKLIMPITIEEGTGLVHTSTSTGQEDHQLGKKLGLPVIPAINDRAEYLDGFGDLVGLNAKKHPEIVIDYLKSSGFLFKSEKYTHRYPACWRCKTELVWKVTDEWYISMDLRSKIQNSNVKSQNLTLRERMMKVTRNIKWLPEFGLDRELDWLANMHDWLISKKNRYWGLALPIWECECNHFEVIGSKEELKEKTVSGWEHFEGKSPHKPQIDEIKLTCPKCNKLMSRIEPVGNPWLDAGIVPFSTMPKAEWSKWFPADFITESFPGQFKNWFYSLIAMSTVLENTHPFKNVLGFASCLAEDGRAMHKSWGNSIEFNEAADKIGVDVMRWMYVRQNPTENLLFGYTPADETRRRFHLKLWNVYNFYTTYATIDGFDSSTNLKLCVLDEWILQRLEETVKKVTVYLDAYDAYRASEQIELLVDDLSLWYIRRSRDRVGPAAMDNADKQAFYQTTQHVLITLCQLLAPFTPFISEEIYRGLTGEESVHLTSWPNSKSETRNPKLIEEMEKGRKVAEIVHAKRKEQAIAVKVPLLKVTLPKSFEVDNTAVLAIVADEINTREIVFGKIETVELDTAQTPEMEEEIKTRELIRKIQNERKELGLNLSQTVGTVSPWLPKDPSNLEFLKRKTQTVEIREGSEFKVTLSEK